MYNLEADDEVIQIREVAAVAAGQVGQHGGRGGALVVVAARASPGLVDDAPGHEAADAFVDFDNALA